jgi:hypothetical protein
VKVTGHAIRRYCLRKGICSPSAAKASIIELLADAEELELKKRYRVRELLDHHDHAQFFRAAGLVFVVRNNHVLTCHDGAAKRWRKMERTLQA